MPAPARPAFTPAPARPSIQFNESFLGRNILPLIAAVLGLVGLVFLGILVVPRMSDPMKIVGMFAISLGVGALGYLLHRRNPSVLTQALVGTGVGGVFVSILVTHLYFHAINEIVAFVMLAGWIVASMWLSKHTSSLLVAILAHVGMVASVVAGYLQLSDDRLILLVVYQIVATAAIILGNVWWSRVMYRFGLFASQAMVIVSMVAMWHRFMGPGPDFASNLPIGLIAAAFLVQFAGSTLLAYLLFISCARVKAPMTANLLAVANAVAWLVILTGAVTVLLGKLAAVQLGLASRAIWVDPRTIPVSLVASLVLAYLPAAAMALAARRIGVKPGVEACTVVPLALFSLFALVVNASVRADSGALVCCAWVVGLSVAYLVLGMATRSRLHTWVGRAALGIDAVLMLVPGVGYDSLMEVGTIWAGLGYLAALLGLACATWFQVGPALRDRYAPRTLAGVFCGAELSLLAIVVFSGVYYRMGLFSIITVAILLGIHFAARSMTPVFYRLAEIAAVLVAATAAYNVGWAMYRASRGGASAADGLGMVAEVILTGLALIGLIVMMVDRVRVAAQATSYALRTPGAPTPDTQIEIVTGLGLTVAIVGLLTPYDWFYDHGANWGWGYPTSLIGLVTALLIVGLGLWSRVKILRLYGLVLAIGCVLKLVLIDIGSVGSITRVVAFLGGAAVCFGISALYNYAAKHFDKNLAAPPVGAGEDARHVG